VSPDPDNLRSEQSVWPLVMAASCLTVLGFVLAFRTGGGGASKHEQPSPVELPGERVDDAEDPGSPVALSYRELGSAADAPDAGGTSVEKSRRQMQLQIEQRRQSKDGGLVISGIEVDIDEVVRSRGDNKPGLEMRRTFQSARVSVADQPAEGADAGRAGESSHEISRQVARMLNGSVERVRMSAAGERQAVDWTSVTNPQVRRTLGLLRAADRMLMPRFRAESVNVGESWSYRFPAPSEQVYQSDHPGLQVDGAVTVTTRFAGVLAQDGRRLAVLDRRLEFQTTGRGGTGKAEPKFSLSGSGRGETLFDLERGVVVDSWLRLDRSAMLRSERHNGGGESTIKLRLRAVDQ
jgi:hypothetical protein